MQGAGHYVVALRSIFAAHVLNHTNVAFFNDQFGSVVVSVEDWAEMTAWRGIPLFPAPRVVAGEFVGIIGRSSKKDWRALGAFRHQDDCVQFHPIAHRDHHFATDIVETVGDWLEVNRSFTGE